MRIVFFGTSAFGLPSLEYLAQSPHTIAAIVTTPDKPKGRHLQLTPSPVKQWASLRGVRCLEAARGNISALAGDLKTAHADVFVVISFGVILPKEILDIPALAALNLHSSLLPRYRGPAPIHWALLNGDTHTGVTVMRLDLTLDTGDILAQDTVPITDKDNEIILHEKLSAAGAATLSRALDLLESRQAVFTAQNEKDATYARKITKEDGRIVWTDAAPAIHNRVRALIRWPGTCAFWKQKRIILLETAVAPSVPQGLPSPGTIIAANALDGILVAAGEGVLCIKSLQLEGRKPLSAAAFLAGQPVKAGDILE